MADPTTSESAEPPVTVLNTAGLVAYQPGGIVSRQILKKATGNITLFAFDEGQELTEHTSPFEALVQAVEGEADITVGGEAHRVRGGEMIVLPARVPHAVRSLSRFKMLLTMIRS